MNRRRLIAALLAATALISPATALTSSTRVVLFSGSGFSPASFPGLVGAWRFDQGVQTDINGISFVAPAWGTGVALTGSGSEPDVAAALGPVNQNMARFNVANSDILSFGTAITLTNATIYLAMAPITFSAQMMVLGHGGANTSFLRLQNSALETTGSVAISTVGNAAVANNLTNRISKNMQIIALTLDSVTAGGTSQVFVNGVAQTAVTGVGTTGLILDRIGIGGNGSLFLNAFVGVVLIYQGLQSAAQVAQMTNYLATNWRGKVLFTSSTGSDSSISPWNSTTPFQTIGQLFNFPIFGDETLAVAPGVIWRVTGANTPAVAANPRVTINGDYFGTGTPAQFRASIAPALTQVPATTIYTATVGTEPQHFVYYVPGGIVSTSTAVLDAVVRLTKTAGTQTTPGVGEWGIDSTTLYVNAGVTLSANEIEVPQNNVTAPITEIANYTYRNMTVAFTDRRCWSNTGVDNAKFFFCNGFFSQSDGFDSDNTFAGMYVFGCMMAYCGLGPVGTGGSAGDGFSFHNGATAQCVLCIGYMNDKAQFDHTGGVICEHDQCMATGTLCFRSTAAGSGGALSFINCIASVPGGVLTPNAVQNNHATTTMTVEFCTLYTGAGLGIGINNVSTGVMVTKDNIVQGFATGAASASGTYTGDYNCMFNTSNYGSGVVAGAHDIVSNPLLTNPAAGTFTLQSGSPCIGAGIAIAGISTNFAGQTRGNPPNMGAY